MAFPPPANVLVNFLAASRKNLLIPFGLFGPNDNLNFIYSISSGSGGNPVSLLGTIDGTNQVFTTPTSVVNGVVVFRNGIAQDPTLSYSLSGSTITFNAQNVPQIGDDLMALVN